MRSIPRQIDLSKPRACRIYCDKDRGGTLRGRLELRPRITGSQVLAVSRSALFMTPARFLWARSPPSNCLALCSSPSSSTASISAPVSPSGAPGCRRCHDRIQVFARAELACALATRRLWSSGVGRNRALGQIRQLRVARGLARRRRAAWPRWALADHRRVFVVAALEPWFRCGTRARGRSRGRASASSHGAAPPAARIRR